MKDVAIMIDDVKFNYRVGLLIEKRGRVLVEFNPEIDFVTLPGGRVKTLEDSITALTREIYEELGVKIKKDEIMLKSLIENFFELDGRKYHELYFLYRLKVKSNDNRFLNNMKNKDAEGCYFKWVLKSKLADVNLLPEVLRSVSNNKFEAIINNDLK